MEFLRYIVLLLIISGSTSIGFLLSRSYTDRVKELRELSNLINMLKNKITFTHMPLGEIFEDLSKVISNKRISNVLKNVSKNIKQKSFENVWNEAIDKERKFLNLKNEDIILVKSLGNLLGKTDIEGQISELNQFSNMLNFQIQKAEEESKKNEKMYKSLGTIIGLVIVIILF